MTGHPIDEATRAQLFEEYDILDTAPERAFDDVVDFAAALCETPTALVSLVEGDRQWFKARLGLDMAETPRAASFCALAMLDDAIMVIPDAAADPRFADNPLVTGAPHIRFYAGAPLVSRGGIPLGSLCVIDQAPRAGLTALQVQGLRLLAAQVVRLLETRRALRTQERHDAALAASAAQFRVLTDAMPQMVWSTRADGFPDYFNARWYEFTGVAEGATDGEAWSTVLHPDDQARAWAAWSDATRDGEPYEIEYRMRHRDGEYRWALARALPVRDAIGAITRWFGTCTDIQDHRLLVEECELVAQELSHRIKNIFAVIAGLVHFSARAHPELKPLVADLNARILALGRAHDFVRPNAGAARSKRARPGLHGMLEKLFAPYAGEGGARIAVTGDDPPIDDRAATPIALIFHELATNAAKYGALSSEGGCVALTIECQEGACMIDWRETGGPVIAGPPDAPGFGSRLIEISVATQLKGKLDLDWRAQGLAARLTIPRSSLDTPCGN